MFLEKLEIQGFKSFAHKTVLEFPKRGAEQGSRGITCIVGPNGSGKSNFADAIRWALGEQSIKTLRGKKSEDVIFFGSDKKARLGFAEVAIYFNNEDHSAPIEYTELVIARRLYRDGESDYLVNNQKVRLQDIQMLLAQSNFAQKTYSVIGQGMIEGFLLVSPWERKEFFDEAAGVKVLDIKRDQSMRKLEQTIVNLEQAEGLMREIEPRLRSLTRQVKRLEQKEKLEQELKILQENYFGELWHEVIGKLQKAEQLRTGAETQKRAKEEEMRGLQGRLTSMEQAELKSSAFLAMQQEYEKVQEEKTKLREQELLVRNQIASEERASSKLPEIISLPEIVDQVEELLAGQKTFLARLQQVKSLAELEELKKESASLLKVLQDLYQRLAHPGEVKKVEASPKLKNELNDVVQEIAQKNQDLKTIQDKIVTFTREEQTQKGEFFALQRQIQQKQYELNELVNHANDSRVECARLETRRDDLRVEIEADDLIPDSLPKEATLEIDQTQNLPRIRNLKHQLALIGSLDPETLQEFKETDERYTFLLTHTTDLKDTLTSLEQVIIELDSTIKKQFDSAFSAINLEFQRFFKVLFNGGRANLILVKGQQPADETEAEGEEEESEDEQLMAKPDKELSMAQKFLKAHQLREQSALGVDIEATPPGKRLKNINMLSGGERALTSIALISGIIANSPSPFVVLDEVDAALDESNAIRFAQILTELSHKTQFIVVTHNRYTMEHASILYGVTMGDDGISEILSLKLEEAEAQVAK